MIVSNDMKCYRIYLKYIQELYTEILLRKIKWREKLFID